MDSAKWSDFDLPDKILESLQENSLQDPLPIQVKTLQAALADNKHVLGAAQTGSGKTLAYTVPIVERILKYRDRPSSMLKKKLCKINQKKEDFELIDGQMVAVEDMIVDKLSDDGSDNVKADVSDGEVDQSLSGESEAETSTNKRSDLTCPEAIILVPTRELAVQVKEEVDKICKTCKINTCCLIGGLSQEKQIRILHNKRPEIIIATPGRLYDMVESNEIEHINLHSIASIRTLVIDEADRMMQKGHFDEMIKLIDIIKESAHHRMDDFSYRVYLFSATLTFIHEMPDRLRPSKLNKKSQINSNSDNNKKKKKKSKNSDPVELNKNTKINQMLTILGVSRQETEIIDLNNDASHGRPSADQLSEFKISCLVSEKDIYLYYFLITNQNKRTLVFCNSKDCLRRLVNVTKYLGIKSLQLHADMDQKQRMKNLEKFRKNKDSVLVATDVAARGLDIKNMDCVVHYQVPKTCESYIHRSGRTARLNEHGVSLTLCEPKEVQFYRRICNQINSSKDIPDYEIDINLRLLLADRVKLAQQCDLLDHHLREIKSNENWFTKAAKDADIDLDAVDMAKLSGRNKSREEDQQVDAKNRRRLSVLQKQLNSLLKKPLVHHGKKLVD